MNLHQETKDGLLVALVILVAFGVGYLTGASGPWHAYANTLQEVLVFRDIQLAAAHEAVQQTDPRFSDALRLLENLALAVESGEGLDEALEQATYRLDEWAGNEP